MPEGKGLLIVYTGPGKGKTTCALGTAFRAVGQGLRVMMVQFIKGSWHYGELDAAKMLGDDKFEIRPMGRGFVKIGGAETDPEDVKMCEEAWEFGRAQIYSEKYDLVVLDEINYVTRPPETVAQLVPGRSAGSRPVRWPDPACAPVRPPPPLSRMPREPRAPAPHPQPRSARGSTTTMEHRGCPSGINSPSWP